MLVLAPAGGPILISNRVAIRLLEVQLALNKPRKASLLEGAFISALYEIPLMGR